MSRNPLVSRAQDAPYKPLSDVVRFWVEANRSEPKAEVVTDGTTTTTVHGATSGGAVTEFVVDAAGGHGWPGTPARRQAAPPIQSFSGAKRVWGFFEGKRRDGKVEAR
jgi:poly(3-hydroxybutyrate) depolymerase